MPLTRVGAGCLVSHLWLVEWHMENRRVRMQVQITRLSKLQHKDLSRQITQHNRAKISGRQHRSSYYYFRRIQSAVSLGVKWKSWEFLSELIAHSSSDNIRISGAAPWCTSVSVYQKSHLDYSYTPNMSNKNQPTLVNRKIAVLGFRAVGKTSLTNAFVTGTFSDQ